MRSAQGSCGCDLLFCIASQRSRIGLAQPGCDAQASVTNHLGRHQALRLDADADAVISNGQQLAVPVQSCKGMPRSPSERACVDPLTAPLPVGRQLSPAGKGRSHASHPRAT